jgi:hypothetical protein
MRFIRIFQVVAMILLISTLGVKAASAAEEKSELMLDSGFVGRAVSLDLFNDTFRIGWDVGSLARPVNLTVVKTSEGAVTIQISDPSAFVSGTMVQFGLAGEIADHPAFHMIASDGTISSYQAIKQGSLLTGTIPVFASASLTLVSDALATSSESEPRTDASVSLVPSSEQTVLTLDAGFINRPVSLDLFGGDVTVAWDAKTLIQPTTLTVTSMRGGTWADQETAANGINLSFSDPAAVSASGTFSVKHRALRPPTSNEHPSVNIFAEATSTQSATFSGTTMAYVHSAAADVSFAPVYCSGIMRSGSATWYRYKGCLCAASPDVPKGTKLKVSRQDDPTKSVTVTVNDYGPDRSIFPDRVIDLDRVAFAAIGNPRGGVLQVTVDKIE